MPLRTKRLRWMLALVAASLIVGGLLAIADSPSPEPLEKLTLVAPPGPMAIPMAYLVVNDKLSAIAEEIDFYLWSNPNQLKAIIAEGEADFVTMPSNSAAIYYNTGLGVRLLDISVWNILYVISEDESIGAFSDLAGREVYVPFPGSIPDLMYKYVSKANGLDPLTDIATQYAATPQYAAQMILSGEAETVVLPEPLATSVMMQTMNSDRPLHRVVRFDTELAGLGDAVARSAIAGTVVLPAMQEHPELVEIFMNEYEAAVAWMLENPNEAGIMAEENLPELGFKAGPTAMSLQNIDWEYVRASEGADAIGAFLEELMTLSPDVVGGKLPDAAFYYDGTP